MNFTGAVDSDYDVEPYVCVLVREGTATRDEIIRCAAHEITKTDEDYIPSVLQGMMLFYCSLLVFYMQTGFAMVCAGAVRKKNVRNAMLKNLLDLCGGSVAFFTVGYALAFGGDYSSGTKSLIGTNKFCLVGVSVDDFSFWFFQFSVGIASTTIIAGTLAERCQMVAYLAYSVVMAGWLYPVIAHALWNPNGYLSPLAQQPLWGVGAIDFAGAGVVHLTGGATALVATTILGPRRGRFYDHNGKPLDQPKEIPGHSPALQILGTIALWFGWFGFNAGSALTHKVDGILDIMINAVINTILAGGTAGIVCMTLNYVILERVNGEGFFDLRFAMNGALSGLVAITGCCGIVENWVAVIVGFVSALLYPIGSYGLIQFRLDDAVDAIPVHMLNGIWGIIAVGLFAEPDRLQVVYERSEHPGLIYSSDGVLLGAQFLALLYILGWVVGVTFPFFKWLDYRGMFRADPLEEIVGLDLSYHGGLVLGDNAPEGYLLADEEVEPIPLIGIEDKKSQYNQNTETSPFCNHGRLEPLRESDYDSADESTSTRRSGNTHSQFTEYNSRTESATGTGSRYTEAMQPEDPISGPYDQKDFETELTNEYQNDRMLEEELINTPTEAIPECSNEGETPSNSEAVIENGIIEFRSQNNAIEVEETEDMHPRDVSFRAAQTSEMEIGHMQESRTSPKIMVETDTKSAVENGHSPSSYNNSSVKVLQTEDENAKSDCHDHCEIEQADNSHMVDNLTSQGVKIVPSSSNGAESDPEDVVEPKLNGSRSVGQNGISHPHEHEAPESTVLGNGTSQSHNEGTATVLKDGVFKSPEHENVLPVGKNGISKYQYQKTLECNKPESQDYYYFE